MICISVILSAFTLVAIGYLWVKKQYRYFKDKGLPYIPPKFPLGNLRGVGKVKHSGVFIREVYEYIKRKDTLGGVFFFVRPVVVPTDLDLIKQVLVKDFQSFHDRGFYVNERDDPLSGHLIALSGQRWKNLRAKLTPTYTAKKLKMMHGTIAVIGQRFQECLEGYVGQDVEIGDIISRFTTDVIGSCAFGIECNSLKDPNTEFRTMAKKVSDVRGFKFFKRFLLTLFPNVGRALRMSSTPKDVSDFFMGSLREMIDMRERNNIKRDDFLELLMQIKNTGRLEGEDVDLGKMTFEELAAQTFVFFIAGYGTSAFTTTFVLYELALDQSAQDRARKELQQILEKHGEFSYEACMEMKYIDQIIKETLRLHPILPNLIRNLNQDYKIPERNLVFEKGSFFSIPVIGIHYDPEIYPDPYKFNPERFTEENSRNRHSCAWLPFGEGPRNCIGKRFGIIEVKIGLAMLLSKFKIKPTPKTPIPMQYDPAVTILTPKGGMWLKLEHI
ncbi:probable cytochrome P450 6a14 [Lutzomyia longipalpis]|uniref:probable cytochrome P450 6a14 n=1 Tax=Lutzomyia longipalpis TaxID=7200 RepID=UPI002483968C|nr:probable cytochrome P450 6a14 [Lutzomyia longipalpis]